MWVSCNLWFVSFVFENSFNFVQPFFFFPGKPWIFTFMDILMRDLQNVTELELLVLIILILWHFVDLLLKCP